MISDEEVMDIVKQTLKEKWFELSPKENFPDTPEVTQQLDILERQIGD